MAKKRVSTFPLEEEIQLKLRKANLKTVEDVLSLSFLRLMASLRLSADETQKLTNILISSCLPRSHNDQFFNGPLCGISHLLRDLEKERVALHSIPSLIPNDHWLAYDMLLSAEGPKGIDFGDPNLDQLLHDGIKFGTLVEFTGPPGVGKTQFCFHLSLKCLLMNSSNAVCCIDTEGAFRTERLLEMFQNCDGIQGREEELLSKFYLFQPKTIESLTDILKSLELFCIEKEVRLLVIDSVASLARKEFSSESIFQRAETLSSWAAQFKSLAHLLNIVVVVTNQITSRLLKEPREDQEANENEDSRMLVVSPALGGTWTHFVNTRFILQFQDTNVRQLIIAKSPVSPIAVKNYRITTAGVEFFGELSYTYSGMNPDKHQIKVQPSLL